MKCSYTKTCCRRVKFVVTSKGWGPSLPGEHRTTTYRYCAYHWADTGLSRETIR